MTTAFVIRFHYEMTDPRFEWRFSYFRDEVLPRILAQEGDFDIAIRCNPKHASLFRSLCPRIKTFTVKNEGVRYKWKSGKRYFLDFVPWSEVIGLEPYELQLGIDSDDLIMPGYLSDVRKHIAPYVKLKESVHVCFQPEIMDVKTGQIHKMRQRYHTRKGSAFFAIYQPFKSDFVFAYEESHLVIGRRFNNQIMCRKVEMCFASVHELNESTRV